MTHSSSTDLNDWVDKHPLSLYLQNLSLLDGLLRGHNLVYGVDRWQNLHDLLLHLAQAKGLPQKVEGLLSLFSPLFCRSPEEIERFRAVFDEWCLQCEGKAESESDTATAALASPAQRTQNREEKRQQQRQEQQHQARMRQQEEELDRGTRLPWRMLMLLGLLGVSLLGLLGWFQAASVDKPTPALVVITDPPIPDEPIDPSEPIELVQQTSIAEKFLLQALPQMITPKPLSEAWRRLFFWTEILLLWLLPLLALLWFLYGVLQRQHILQSSKGDKTDPLAKIRLRRHEADLFDRPETRALLRRLHNPISTLGRDLDVEQTVERTLERAGLFMPAFQQQRWVPEIVMLVDSYGYGDMMVELAETLYERLCQAGLEVTLYRYRLLPERVFQPDLGWQSLDVAELSERHPCSHLLLVANPLELLDADSMPLKVLDWVAELTAWSSCSLLATRAAGEKYVAILEQEGLYTLPLSEAGVEHWVRNISGRAQRCQAPPLPTLPRCLRVELFQLMETPAEFEQEVIYSALQIYLGDRSQLLAAISLYPRLHWGLIRGLDYFLFPEVESGERGLGLLRLAQLPFCREGVLPAWLRQRFQEDLDDAAYKNIQGIYWRLLKQSAGRDEAAIELVLPQESSAPDGALKRYLRALLGSGEYGNVLQDGLFVQLMLGGKRKRSDFELPSWIAEELLSRRWLLVVKPLLLALLLGGGGYWSMDALWPWAKTQLLAETKQAQTGDLRPRDELSQPLAAEALQLMADSSNFAAGKREPAPRLGVLFQDTLKDGSKAPKMVVIPAGSFQMGCVSGKSCEDNEKPVHQVTLSKNFALSQTEVTFEDYDRFAKATKRELPDDEGWGRGRRPVINVSWNDAKAYVKWLSGQTGEQYRLPTEAEWEYAARAGTITPFSTGDCIATDQANYNGYPLDECDESEPRGKTLAVGSFLANAFGLQDMHGNVWEWTEDCSHGGYTDAPNDGRAWFEGAGAECGERVIRGGSWFNNAVNMRSALRIGDATGDTNFIIGFRIARALF